VALSKARYRKHLIEAKIKRAESAKSSKLPGRVGLRQRPDRATYPVLQGRIQSAADGGGFLLRHLKTFPISRKPVAKTKRPAFSLLFDK
jgi:hypothetical protein